MPFSNATTILAVTFASLVLTTGCSDTSSYPWLSELDPVNGVKAAGKRLMALPEGLHLIEREKTGTTLLVGVHGFRSEGYEWVYPLKTMNSESVRIGFFRWNYNHCPGPTATQLATAIATVPGIDRVVLIGHSLGGQVVAELIDEWSIDKPLEVHIVAAPLKIGSRAFKRCGFVLPSPNPEQVSVFEWRTVKAQDGAFKDRQIDPQNVDIPGSTVTRLPSEYRGKRLGHNWSLSWLADELSASRSNK